MARASRSVARPQKAEQLPLPGHGPVPPPATVAPPKRLTEQDRQRRAIRALREQDKRQKQYEAVQKRLKVRKRDATIIFVLANDQERRVGKRKIITARAGERVARDDKRKVFAFRHTRPSKKYPKGRLVPYRDWNEKEKLRKIGLTPRKVVPKAVKITSIDPTAFKSKQAEAFFYAGRTRAERPVTVQKRRNVPLDFMDNVVPKVADRLQSAANQYIDRRHFILDCAALVRTPAGKTMAIRFDADFKQADMQQFMATGFYEPYVSRKLYAEMAEQLKGEGLVTTGSAQYIEQLPINAGKGKKEWRDSKGMLWKRGQGWQLKEVELIRFDAQPNLIVVRSAGKG